MKKILEKKTVIYKNRIWRRKQISKTKGGTASASLAAADNITLKFYEPIKTELGVAVDAAAITFLSMYR